MLETIKETIKSVQDLSFPEYYQEYIKSVQDNIIERDMCRVNSIVSSIDKLNSAEKEINTMIKDFISGK